MYVRKLYPEAVFELKKKYGVPVYNCIHPDIKSYISECLKTAYFYLTKRQLHRVFVCFHSSQEVHEKYTFDIIDLNSIIKRYFRPHCFNFNSLKMLHHFRDLFLVELEQSMRNCILKISASQSYLTKFPDKSSFSIRLQTNFYSNFEFNQDPNHEVKKKLSFVVSYLLTNFRNFLGSK